MNCPISLELPGPSLLDDSKRAADNGLICFIDYSTLRQIEDRLGSESFTQKYDFIPLFGEPIRMPAGLPYTDSDVGKYLWYRWRYEEPNTFAEVLGRLVEGNGHVTPPGFRLIDRTELPADMVAPGILTTRNSYYYRQIASLIGTTNPAEQL